MAVWTKVRDWIENDLVLHGFEADVCDWIKDDLVLNDCKGRRKMT